MVSIFQKKKTIKQINKSIQKRRKKVATTLDWIHVERIDQQGIVLKYDKKFAVVKGIKIVPYDIFLASPVDQKKVINQLRKVYNNISFDLYHGFVFNPVDLSHHLAQLSYQYEYEEDEVRKQMFLDDMNKALMFIDTFKELEFFIFVKEYSEKKLEKNYSQLKREIGNTSLQFKELNLTDYENYISNVFENKLLNDYYFSKGEFKLLEGEELHD